MPQPAHPRRQKIRRLLRLASSFVGAALVGAIGWMLAEASLSVGTAGTRVPGRFGWLVTAFGESLARLSYDVPFVVRGRVEPPRVCIIYMDEDSSRKLLQGAIWDRALHAQLLRAITPDQPRAVFFDVTFHDEGPVPAVDADFAQAIRENGRVFLGASREDDPGIVFSGNLRAGAKRILAPIRTLREASAGWGLFTFQPLDADYGVRRISPGLEDVPTAPWRAAVKLGAALEDTAESRMLQTRWLNYYGPAGTFESISYHRVVSDQRPPPGYFRDRIVVIGLRSTLGGVNLGKDDFRNPFGLIGGGFSGGVEVHLTALLNLLHGEWLTRLPVEREIWLVGGFGVLLGGFLPRFRPTMATLFALVAAVLVAGVALWLFGEKRLWFAWAVPVFVQTPLALFWAVSSRYFIEERRRNALRAAFGRYLSPHLADRIADSDFELTPGGSVAEVTVLFTDLEGFTTLSEKLENPELVTEVLLKYFARTSEPILRLDGMIINFVGDAVTAVWGAPLTEKNHARKAALAAWTLHQNARLQVDGHRLRTRVGIHTGRVLAGNVGSAERFDYAVVGDPVNFASRLEGLNKIFGTNVLISEAIRVALGDEFRSRRLGEFRVVGKTVPCVIHEFLGPTAETVREAWCDLFEEGVAAFQKADFDTAEARMRETIARRPGGDPPAEFYLRQIATMRRDPLPPGWDGVIDIDRK